jgi:hypothetical protein
VAYALFQGMCRRNTPSTWLWTRTEDWCGEHPDFMPKGVQIPPSADEIEVERLQRALKTISGGHATPSNGGPDINETGADQFRHAMWTWSQRIAREALNHEEKAPIRANSSRGGG